MFTMLARFESFYILIGSKLQPCTVYLCHKLNILWEEVLSLILKHDHVSTIIRVEPLKPLVPLSVSDCCQSVSLHNDNCITHTKQMNLSVCDAHCWMYELQMTLTHYKNSKPPEKSIYSKPNKVYYFMEVIFICDTRLLWFTTCAKYQDPAVYQGTIWGFNWT